LETAVKHKKSGSSFVKSSSRQEIGLVQMKPRGKDFCTTRLRIYTFSVKMQENILNLFSKRKIYE
jgi:hypothetical protein